jgi:hypothetical protein
LIYRASHNAFPAAVHHTLADSSSVLDDLDLALLVAAAMEVSAKIGYE